MGATVKTSSGSIVATDDFKFDFAPAGESANLHRTVKLGEEGVLCLLSDSTNAEISTFTKSEKMIGTSVLEVLRKIDDRIISTSFVSNIFRSQQVADTAMKTGRKIAVFGHSMEDAIISDGRSGYIKVPKGMFVDATELNQLPTNEAMILCTGSQEELMATLSRIANGAHRQINIQPGDTVVFSSSPIPGNTTSANRLISLSSEADAEVTHGKINDIHTSDHGGQEEQKLMLYSMKPKYFMPVHGEFKMSKIHVSLVQDTEVSEENYSIMDNDDILALIADSAYPAGHFNADDVCVDGNGVDDIGNVVLRDRCILSKEGLILAVATVDIKNKEIMAGPDILSRGFVYMHESGDMIHEDQRLLFNALRKAMKDKSCTEAKLGEAMATTLRPFLSEQTEYHPVILPMVVTVIVSGRQSPHLTEEKNVRPFFFSTFSNKETPNMR